MTLHNRYPGLSGQLRLDNEADPQEGPALDLMSRCGSTELWVRESGQDEGKSARIDLSIEDVWALRHALDGCLLSHYGVSV